MDQLFGILVSLHQGTPQHGEWVVACLRGAWPNLIGERLASACRPAAFQNSELTIEITEGGWEKAARSVESTILDKLRAATAGRVRSISWKVPDSGQHSTHM